MKKLINILLALVLLPLVSVAGTANLQVIHNAADPAAEVVDIYVNGDLFLDNFAFRDATPFVEVPSDVQLDIGVAPGTSSSADDIIATIPVTLAHGKTYVAIANGVLDPSMFFDNPNMKLIGFNLFARDGIRTKSWWKRWVNLIAFHGATDAPKVDVRIKDWPWGPLFSDLTYGEFSRYRGVYAKEYILEVTPAGDRNTIVESYAVDLSGLGGGAAVVFASGFLDPSVNQNGPAFGLFAALPDGTVIELEAQSSAEKLARLQVIHNAADPAASVVDIYVNGDLFLNDFAFRDATPFVDVPAEIELAIGVAPGNSSSSADVLATIPVTLAADETYIAIANGVLDPSQFAENPDMKSIGFALYPVDDVKERSKWSFAINLQTFHGATDAPMVDIITKYKSWRWKLNDDLGYGEFGGNRVLFPLKYYLEVVLANNNNAIVGIYEADLRELGGGAGIVFASGFVSSTENQYGPGFGLFLALSDGTVVELPNRHSPAGSKVADESLPTTFQLNGNYPNPFNPTTSISFSIPTASSVTLKVYNVLGQEVRTLVNGQMESGEHIVEFDASGLASGIYLYRMESETFTDTRKMLLLK